MVSTELLDVLFWKDIKDFLRFYKEHVSKGYAADEYRARFNAYLIDKIKTKTGFAERIEDYHVNGTAIWQDQSAQNCDYLRADNIQEALFHGSRKNGERRSFQAEEMLRTWACHLNDYAWLVNYEDNINILELATGAGLGTYAVMKALPHENRFISVDIDFSASRNADGLAQYLNISDRAGGLSANFWSLPFEDGIFDTVCTHYGIDESREIQAVIAETARVLKSGGRIVIVARDNPYDRHRNIMSLFDISEDECGYLLKKARLYSGFADLTALMEKYGLTLTKNKLYEPEASPHRVLGVFLKIDNYQC